MFHHLTTKLFIWHYNMERINTFWITTEFCNVFHTTKQPLNLAFCYFQPSMSSSEKCTKWTYHQLLFSKTVYQWRTASHID
jgi:hypothetical protein